MKKVVILLVCITVLLTGCDDKKCDSKIPDKLNDLPRPVVVLACNDGGLAVLDADGNLYSWGNEFYFVGPFLKSDLKKGDVLLPERKSKRGEK